ncbi:malate synthase A [Streptosporangium carneum]|uniref:Malate synthase n=1 Tax=Streptosporangium carneum TaxID=47481 RepID=A0A9W6I0U0_9ACTN|nr:malate synthase A [Streptosporangium carneum]GLK09603.1 malate synthase [Streptosporangium carneum]
MTTSTDTPPPGVRVAGPPVAGAGEVLTGPALAFVAELHRRFAPVRNELLAARAVRRAKIAAEGRCDFLPETAGVRAGDWRVPPPPADLADRRVEITGPAERRMTVNALRSGAKVWLADFEDSLAPRWSNVIAGQINLSAAIARDIDEEIDGKRYELPEGPLATIVMRPRGWHLDERNLEIDGEPAVAALVDFGLYFLRNAHTLLERGSGPYFYLPKLESHREAALWNEVFLAAQAALGLPAGTIRATVLIETITAAFEMDEILHALGPHAAGLNAGRWDYLFSIVKTFRDAGAAFVLPDRNTVTMTAGLMRAYTDLLVATCHRRGAHAIGGMSAFIPSRRDPEANRITLDHVRADKRREAGDGFDGSWVAHPDLVPVCREVFDETLGDRPNQLGLQRRARITADQLLDVRSAGDRFTRAGLDNAADVLLRYLAAWLGGSGAVGIHNLMEDVATAEICRSQLWQWRHNAVRLDDGVTVTAHVLTRALDERLAVIREELGEAAYAAGHWSAARELAGGLVLSDDYADFLTQPAYPLLTEG